MGCGMADRWDLQTVLSEHTHNRGMSAARGDIMQVAHVFGQDYLENILNFAANSASVSDRPHLEGAFIGSTATPREFDELPQQRNITEQKSSWDLFTSQTGGNVRDVHT